jgi:hypothetical protein
MCFFFTMNRYVRNWQHSMYSSWKVVVIFDGYKHILNSFSNFNVYISTTNYERNSCVMFWSFCRCLRSQSICRLDDKGVTGKHPTGRQTFCTHIHGVTDVQFCLLVQCVYIFRFVRPKVRLLLSHISTSESPPVRFYEVLLQFIQMLWILPISNTY